MPGNLKIPIFQKNNLKLSGVSERHDTIQIVCDLNAWIIQISVNYAQHRFYF
jgi:hypothetical protein